MHLPSPSFNFYRTQTFYILWVLHMSRQLSNHSAVLCRVLLTVYISHDTDPLTSNPERGCLIICAAGIVVISPKTCKQAQCFFLEGGGGSGACEIISWCVPLEPGTEYWPSSGQHWPWPSKPPQQQATKTEFLFGKIHEKPESLMDVLLGGMVALVGLFKRPVSINVFYEKGRSSDVL